MSSLIAAIQEIQDANREGEIITDQEINIAIAEVCGWTYFSCNIPNYCNDLNAMHEAERTLNIGQMIDYSAHLYHISVPKIVQHYDHFIDHVIAGYIATATSRQRAEAFLRTIGKWEEAK